MNSIAAMLAATVLGAAVPAGSRGRRRVPAAAPSREVRNPLRVPLSIDTTFPPPRDHRRPDLSIEKAHPGPVTLVAYTGDGRLLASAGADRAVRLWHARPGDLTAGKLAQTLDGHDAPAVAMAAQGQPALLVVLAGDGNVHRWESATGKLVDQRSLGGKLLAAAIRPGPAPQAAVVSTDGLALVDHQSGQTLRKLAPEKPALLAFAADGKTLAAAVGKRVQWWDAEAGTLVRAVEAPAPVRALLVVGSSVAAGHADGSVSLWPVTGEAAAQRIQTAVRPIAALGAGSKGDLLGVAGRGAVEIWDVATLQKLCTLASAGTTAAIAFNPNGQKLVTAGSDRAVRYWTVPLPPIAADDLQRIQAALPDHASVAPKRPRRLLVFWRAEAILHKAGVPAGNKAIELLGERTGAFQADFSRDYEVFDPRILRRYDAIVLNSTAHLAIPEERQRQALLEYVRAGGGVVGIHAAIDMFKRWPEGAEVVGATFGGHPWGPERQLGGDAGRAGPPAVAGLCRQGLSPAGRVLRAGPAVPPRRPAGADEAGHPRRRHGQCDPPAPHGQGLRRVLGEAPGPRARVLRHVRPPGRTVHEPGRAALLSRRHPVRAGRPGGGGLTPALSPAPG